MALRNQEIGGRLRELRGEKPQTAVADELGVSERAVQNWESGDAKPSYRNLQRLAEYYGVREDFILTGTSDTPSPFPADPETADERWARMEAAVELHATTIRSLLREQSQLLEEIRALSKETREMVAETRGIKAETDELWPHVRAIVARSAPQEEAAARPAAPRRSGRAKKKPAASKDTP